MNFHSQLMYIWAMPLTANLLMMLAAILLFKITPHFSRFLWIFSFVTLWLLSSALVSNLLIKSLENKYPALDYNQLKQDRHAVIVVLGGGSDTNAREYSPHHTINDDTLVRLRYAVLLHNKTKAPLLTSGGDIDHPIYGYDMKEVAEREFHVPVRWVEARGENTAQEAVDTQEILKPLGIKRIYLVTDAWHMPRAVYAYRKVNFEVIPAPTHFLGGEADFSLFALIPTAEAIDVSATAIHEYIGLIWYHLFHSTF